VLVGRQQDSMVRLLPAPIRGALAFLSIATNTLLWCVPVYVGGLVKLIPIPRLRAACARSLVWMAESWIATNNAILRISQDTRWDVSGVDALEHEGWYLIVCNHQSWADILVLQKVFAGRAPFLKFFLKRELIWVPVMGWAWWALDFPFMQRYSAEQIAKRPELRGKDLETTRKACERFRTTPVSILNFLEGTRFTTEKHDRQGSPFERLLKPKAGGVGFVLGAMGDQLHTLVDVTIVYPDGARSFWDFLCGRVPLVVVRAREVPIPAELLGGSYADDAEFRARIQSWVGELWSRKDALIDEIVGAAQDHEPEEAAA
jgi:1-acyl-sn-glycerol-3-phosphate acyltransferase